MRFVIVIPVQSTVLNTVLSIFYNYLYGVINAMLNQAVKRIIMEIITLGHRAVVLLKDGYHVIASLKEDPSAFFFHCHAAYLA